MKPTNKKEYNRSIIGFFVMWAITTALLVFACLQPFKTPKFENTRLKKQVEALEADSIQQYLLSSTISGINSTMESLNTMKIPNTDTLEKLRNYPNVELTDTKMKKELASISQKIADVYQQNTMNGSDLQKQLRDCNEKLSLKDERIETFRATIVQKDSEINQLKYLNRQ